MPHVYSVYEAKARLSEVLRDAKRGLEVVVKERGIPIARVVPYQEDPLERRLKRLVASGNILPRRRVGKLPRGEQRSGGLRRFIEERE